MPADNKRLVGRSAVPARLTLAFAGSALAALAALGVLLVTLAAARLSDELRSSGETFGHSLARDIEKALDHGTPFDRLAGMTPFLENAIETQPLVMAVTVTGGSGSAHYVGQRRGATDRTWALPASVPLRAEGTIVGTINVELDLAPLLNQLIGTALRILGLLAVATALAGILAMLAYRSWVIRPATALRDGMLAFAASGSSVRPTVTHATGGLRILARALDRARVGLRSRRTAFADFAYAVRAGHFDPSVLERIGGLAAEIAIPADDDDGGRPVPGHDERRPLTKRIAVLAALAIVVVAGATALAVDQRHAAVADALDREVVEGLRTLLRAEWENDRTTLARAAETAATSPEIRSALAGGGDTALRARIERFANEINRVYGITRLEIADKDGQPIVTESRRDDTAFDARTLATVARTGEPVFGLLQDDNRAYTLAFAGQAVDGPNRGTVTLGFDAEQVLARLAHNADSVLLLVDSRGRAAFASDPSLEGVAIGHLSATQASVATRTFNGRVFRLVEIPLGDVGGRMVAHLVALRPIDDAVAIEQRVTLLAGLAVLVTLLAAIFLVRVQVRRIVRPLDQAIDAVVALSNGDATAEPPRDAGTRQAAALAAAAHLLKARDANLSRLRVSRAKQQRRQQRFVRQQMQGLADTLDDDARDAVLADLAKLEEMARQTPVAAAGDGEDLTLLGAAFQNLSQRIRNQYQRLSDLIRDLREALSAKMAYLALQQELEVARRLQASMLPKTFPKHGAFAAFGAMEPAKEVGGDFYDVFQLDDGRFGFVVADVSGKGIPAALFMAMSRTLLRATALFGIPPGRCLSRLNDLLEESNEQAMFVTIFYGILDTGKRRLIYANGGHNPPYLIRSGGRIEALPTTRGTALAIIPGIDYAEAEVPLEPGDSLFMFTDGITEAFDVANVMFGEDRVVEALERNRALGPEEMVAAIMQTVHEFAGEAPQSDDMTCLAYRLEPVAALAEG